MRSGLIDLVLCVRGHGGGGNRLGCRPRRRGGGCVGTQEASGALRAEHLGGLPVEEHRAPGDEDGVDGVDVAVDHPRHCAVLVDLFLGVAVQRVVEVRRVASAAGGICGSRTF
jgi:hypothetical protein